MTSRTEAESADGGRAAARPAWVGLPDERLLDLRICDLGLRIRGTWVQERIRELRAELARCGIRFRPHCWLSDEWFAPDGIAGFGIPFYLAHPRLMKLENAQMLDVEGGTREWCLRLLRHETGHAIDNAFHLHRRKEWRRLFGRASQRYPEYYQPRPYSKAYVHNLDAWYAQSHPSEDFAETFAIWLRPNSRWRERYRSWPALRKLEYVDRLMGEIAPLKPTAPSRARVDPVSRMRWTLREHYQAKRESYGTDFPEFFDRDLRRLFSEAPQPGRSVSAATFLNRIRPEIRAAVATWTGEYRYTIDEVLRKMVDRCRELKLRVDRPPEEMKLAATTFLTVQTMNHLHSGKHRLPL